MVIVPSSVGNFNRPCTVEGTTWSCHSPMLPKSILYGEGALIMILSAIIVFFNPFSKSANMRENDIFPLAILVVLRYPLHMRSPA